MNDAGTLQNVEISKIDLDVSNHRTVVGDQALLDLAESIRLHGLMEPVSVYRKPDGRYTLGFGHRWLEAHKLLETLTIPAIVHEAATEADIRAAQAVENLHRKDLTPLEEAQACQQLVDSLVHKTDEPTEDLLDQAAAMVGRTRTWFMNRMALMRLSKECQEALAKGDIYLGHAQQLAKLAEHEAQNEVLDRVSRMNDEELPEPVYRCRQAVEARLQDLSRVSWRLDVPFAGKVACSVCPHNTANQPGLFDGDQPKKPMCLDATCFKEKARAASLATIRASNTLAKMDKASTANAEKAMAEREAEFVKPASVVAAVKRKLTADDDAHTSRKVMDRDAQSAADRKIDYALRDAMNKWKGKCMELVAAEVRKSPARILSYLLLRHQPKWGNANSDWVRTDIQKRAVAALQPKIFALRHATIQGALVRELALEVEIDTDDEAWPLSYQPDYTADEHSAAVLQCFAESLEIELPKQPVREDFTSDHSDASPAEAQKK